jgi:hypothetical protein
VVACLGSTVGITLSSSKSVQVEQYSRILKVSIARKANFNESKKMPAEKMSAEGGGAWSG